MKAGTDMERHTFAMEIKKGCVGKFRNSVSEIWNDLTQLLDEQGIKNFSLWSVSNIVFGYYESGDNFSFSKSGEAFLNNLDKMYGNLYVWISDPKKQMRLMYHDYGIVRESKELIRHSVFITKLMPGAEEEYKRMHDVLSEKKRGLLNEGPDSNFTIWCAGGYIFGYDEIDTSMEKEPTEDEKAATIRWETKMLKIMSWMTNHVDWISGECHPSIQRIAWHN